MSLFDDLLYFKYIEEAKIKCLGLDFPQNYCDNLAYDSKLLMMLCYVMILFSTTLFPILYYYKYSKKI